MKGRLRKLKASYHTFKSDIENLRLEIQEFGFWPRLALAVCPNWYANRVWQRQKLLVESCTYVDEFIDLLNPDPRITLFADKDLCQRYRAWLAHPRARAHRATLA